MLHTNMTRRMARTTETTATPELHLVGGSDTHSAGARRGPRGMERAELLSIAARRCSAFFAEAAVLVLVFGILDFFIQHGHINGGWALGALSISVALLGASVATEFSARRWIGAQP